MKRRAKTRKENSSKNDLAGVVLGDSNDIRLRNCRNLSVVVYTVDEPSGNYDEEVMEKVRERFSIRIPSSLSVHFVHLHELKHLLGEYCQYVYYCSVYLHLYVQFTYIALNFTNQTSQNA